MSKKEITYLKESVKYQPMIGLERDSELLVTSSRVIIFEKNFVLRNIAGVENEKTPLITPLIIISLLFSIGLQLYVANFAYAYYKISLILSIIFIAIVYRYCRDLSLYYLLLQSNGTSSKLLYSLKPDFHQEIVEAINKALLEIDNVGLNSNKEEQPSSDIVELEKLKILLDKGLITQEDYDLKKKQILGI